HWSKYYKPTKAYRALCGWEAKRQGVRRHNDPTAALRVSLTFMPPDNRRRDMDGLLGAFKAGIDGLSDAIGVDDSYWSIAMAKGEKTKGGAVIAKIEVRMP
ncbi:hypothetical protein, partial [Yoonia sp.]|uniref:hypothetical protein n=1 Tax=Yoonia sp. TaxID=2212373 RepID=UPI002E013E54|nr:hypothetical protein [Yoonia sp.]